MHWYEAVTSHYRARRVFSGCLAGTAAHRHFARFVRSVVCTTSKTARICRAHLHAGRQWNRLRILDPPRPTNLEIAEDQRATSERTGTLPQSPRSQRAELAAIRRIS